MYGKTAIVTDTNSGLTVQQANAYGIYLVAMPVIIDGDTYFEDVSISQEEFFTRLRQGADVSTSQPAPGDLLELWDHLLERYKDIIYLPMSSGLSGSCESARMLASEYGGRVYVADNHRYPSPCGNPFWKQSIWQSRERTPARSSVILRRTDRNPAFISRSIPWNC